MKPLPDPMSPTVRQAKPRCRPRELTPATAAPRRGWLNRGFLILAGAAVLPGLLVAAEPTVLFEDRFAGRLAEGWHWLREDPQTWRLRDDALEIRVEPGVAQTVKNALVRQAPDRSARRLAFEVTVTFTSPPTHQYEQAGLTWYADGKPVFKLVHERIDGQTYIIPGKKPTQTRTVQLRLVVSADKYAAQFRPEGRGEFQTAATGDLPPAQREEISLQCYNGPPEAEHWMRFDDFRILQLPD
jgi:hypothetical protein